MVQEDFVRNVSMELYLDVQEDALINVIAIDILSMPRHNAPNNYSII